MGKLVVGYWDHIHGLVSQIRFLLELVGADYEDELYYPEDQDKWFKEKKENLGLIYPNLPYMIDQRDDGKTIKMTEHRPIMRYLARKHGLYPKTEEELLVAEQTESFLWDVRFRQLYAAYCPQGPENYEKVKGEWIEFARQKLPHLDKLLAKNGYVTGKLSYVDIEVFDFFLVVGVFAPELLKEHPNIARHFETINNLPQIQNYRNGKGKGVWKERAFCFPIAAFKGRI